MLGNVLQSPVQSFLDHVEANNLRDQPVMQQQAEQEAAYRQQQIGEFQRMWQTIREKGVNGLREQPVQPAGPTYDTNSN